MWNMVHFLKYVHDHDIEVRRIAVICTSSLTQCHNWHDDPGHSGYDDDSLCRDGRAISGGVVPMQALHGMDEDVALNNLVPGCAQLQEVFWIVKTQLMPEGGSVATATSTLRVAVNPGTTRGQQRVRETHEKEIKLIKEGEGVYRTGKNRWTGDKAPVFSFMCLAPRADVGKVHDALDVEDLCMGRLKGKNWEYIKRVKAETGCLIRVAPCEPYLRTNTEISVYGSRDGVTMAKEMILQRCMDTEARYLRTF